MICIKPTPKANHAQQHLHNILIAPSQHKYPYTQRSKIHSYQNPHDKPYYRSPYQTQPSQPLQSQHVNNSLSRIQPNFQKSHISGLVESTITQRLYQQPQPKLQHQPHSQLQPQVPQQSQIVQAPDQRYQNAIDQIGQLILANSKLQRELQNHQRTSQQNTHGNIETVRLQLVNQELRAANLCYVKRLQELENVVSGESSIRENYKVPNQNIQTPVNRIDISSQLEFNGYTLSSRRPSQASDEVEISGFLLAQMHDSKDVQYIKGDENQRYVKMDREITGLKELLADRNSERRRLEALLEQSKSQETILSRKVVGLEALVELLSTRSKQQTNISQNEMKTRSLSCHKDQTSRLRQLEDYKAKFSQLSEKSERAFKTTRSLQEQCEQYKDSIENLEKLLKSTNFKLAQKEKKTEQERKIYQNNKDVMLNQLQTVTDKLSNQHTLFEEQLQRIKQQITSNFSSKSHQNIQRTEKLIGLSIQNNSLKNTILKLENELLKLKFQGEDLPQTQYHLTVEHIDEPFYKPDSLVTPVKCEGRRGQLPLSTIKEQLSCQPIPSANNSVKRLRHNVNDSPTNYQQEFERLRRERNILQENLQKVESEKQQWEQMYKALRISYIKLREDIPKCENQKQGSQHSSMSQEFTQSSEVNYSSTIQQSRLISWQQNQELSRKLGQLQFKYSLEINHLKRERDQYLGELTKVTTEFQALRNRLEDLEEQEYFINTPQRQ